VTNDASSNSDGLAGPLSGLRVLELADEKGQFCGKLMGDLGAANLEEGRTPAR